MTVTLRRTWTFDAAHQLPNHDGKCARPHGHTYTVHLEVEGTPQPIEGQPDEGMVVDFGVLDDLWAEVKPMLDHQDLNLTVPVLRSTSEHLAMYLLDHFTNALELWAFPRNRHDDLRVAAVTVSETAKSACTVRP